MGILIVLLGLACTGLERFPWLVGWFGRLPGDIRYESERTVVFVPLVSMLLVSAALSAAMYLFRRFQ